MTTNTIPVAALEITNVPSLDPIRVLTQDIGPGQGRIIIECYGQAWSCYWPGMGKQTIRQFVAGADPDYVCNALRNHFHRKDRKIDEYLRRIVKAVQQALAEVEH